MHLHVSLALAIVLALALANASTSRAQRREAVLQWRVIKVSGGFHMAEYGESSGWIFPNDKVR